MALMRVSTCNFVEPREVVGVSVATVQGKVGPVRVTVVYLRNGTAVQSDYAPDKIAEMINTELKGY